MKKPTSSRTRGPTSMLESLAQQPYLSFLDPQRFKLTPREWLMGWLGVSFLPKPIPRSPGGGMRYDQVQRMRRRKRRCGLRVNYDKQQRHVEDPAS